MMNLSRFSILTGRNVVFPVPRTSVCLGCNCAEPTCGIWHPIRRPRQSGFTLIELIMVLVLAGVLSVFVVPKLFNTDDFNARGFHDETLAFLRYAHKTAVAQRRPVCVTFAATTATLTIDADRNTATGANGCETNLTGPRGGTPGAISARGAVQYSAVPSAQVFNGLGQPGAGQTIQVTGAANQIAVEAGTGYVHE